MENNQNSEMRMVSKLFKCPVCLKGFKKLVPIDDEVTRCPECGHEHCTETINSEFNRESVTLDSSYRIPFCNLPNNIKHEFHTVTDTRDKSPNNFYLDNQRQQQNQNADNSPVVFITFNVSPFNGSVNRHPFDFRVFNGPLASDTHVQPSENFFLDNFASNFISNFINPLTRIVFINSMQNQHQGNPPASQTAIDKLKRFKMEDKYCKKNEQNIFEHPECSICLTEISNEQDTILLPCGHMFHDKCIVQWLKIHNTCPLCRYEIQSNDENYEKERNKRNQQREEHIRRNSTIRPVDLNNPESINDALNRNINMQGENPATVVEGNEVEN